MASDAARRFLLSVPLESQLLLGSEGVSLLPERCHLLLFLLLLPSVSESGVWTWREARDGDATRR